MAKVAILLGPDFEDSEFETPRATLIEHGHDVDVIGRSSDEELVGKKGRVRFTPDLAVGEAAGRTYDVIVVPGGYSPDHLRTDEAVVGFLREHAARDVPVAAICHGGSLLVEADLVRGRRVTSWPSIRTDLRNAGAEWVDEEVVEDAGLITSRHPGDLPAFCRAIQRRLGPLMDGEVPRDERAG